MTERLADSRPARIRPLLDRDCDCDPDADSDTDPPRNRTGSSAIQRPEIARETCQNEGMRYEFEPIGHIESPFREKFGIPRQSRLVPSAHARLRHTTPAPRFNATRTARTPRGCSISTCRGWWNRYAAR